MRQKIILTEEERTQKPNKFQLSDERKPCHAAAKQSLDSLLVNFMP
jgi:hypothetical protein